MQEIKIKLLLKKKDFQTFYLFPYKGHCDWPQ